MKAVLAEGEQLRLFDFGGIDLAKLRKVGVSLRSVGGAVLTVRGYASDLRRFESWCLQAGRSASPATAETVTLYVTWALTEAGRRVTTVNRHICAIVDAHRRSGLPVPPIADARSIVSAVRRQRCEQPVGKAALSADDLCRVARWCDGGSVAGLRDRAVLVLGFATALRRSELAALQLSDISFHDKGVAVVVRRSKTDQEGRGRVIAVWAGRRVATDPVRVLSAWIAARGSWPGPLFCRVQTGDLLVKCGISGDSVHDLVKRSVAAVGLDAKLYGAHSLRAGAVTAAAELGRSDQEIMALSGHESVAVMRGYVRRANVFAGRNPLAGVL